LGSRSSCYRSSYWRRSYLRAEDKDLGEAVYIPSIMLKFNTDLFLDDKNIEEVANQLNTKIHVLDDSNDIINNLIGITSSKKF
jgi:NifB/MoaA-like Fe-S oxidoreductase